MKTGSYKAALRLSQAQRSDFAFQDIKLQCKYQQKPQRQLLLLRSRGHANVLHEQNVIYELSGSVTITYRAFFITGNFLRLPGVFDGDTGGGLAGTDGPEGVISGEGSFN